jgi:hypothetical protein
MKVFEGHSCFSFDLKSATDRWPLLLLFEVVSVLFASTTAGELVNTTLGHNT